MVLVEKNTDRGIRNSPTLSADPPSHPTVNHLLLEKNTITDAKYFPNRR